MTLPVIYSVARRYPDLDITVLTSPFPARLFLNPPPNVHVISYRKTRFGLIKLISRLRKERFDYVADLHDLIRSRTITKALQLCGATTATVDKQRSRRRELTKEKSREYQQNYVDRYADVFAKLGFTAAIDFKSLLPESPRHGVGIAPFARYTTKTYPPKLMEQVARQLTDRGISVSLFGARGSEAETLLEWKERNPALIVVAGTLTIEQELEAMSRLQLMVTMDSANMHLASLVATPVISIWGSTIPQCGFLGYGQKPENALMLDLPCQPCTIAGCEACPLGHMECLTKLSPDTIVEQVCNLLK